MNDGIGQDLQFAVMARSYDTGIELAGRTKSATGPVVPDERPGSIHWSAAPSECDHQDL